ncbi:TrkH family potassium uptake protein [Bacillus sp. CMF21]|uniref:TrkH family potassium uptake protein n=1 Tax=Metabacillus dongyingensis TaxID=2874282 RepID=UPI001CBCD03F|nr:TrkH family potassium uptake protein [Metabacillus dongyingensis]UAL54866.1 TrkH family potassium uptake protein [Metabacillus dongyingensis]USK31131.1 TrkH family potassium uptake protein [Bacillus sp. CMF21]
MIRFNPSQLLVTIFAVGIAGGSALLMLPVSTHEPIRWIDALFIATSAMTVTGLAPVDPGSTFTYTGQFIIAMLIQLGGLGIMSFGVLIYILLGRKIGIKERLVMQTALNQTSIGGVINLVKYLFYFSLSIEFIAMIFLSFRWIPEYGWSKGLFYSFFHAISAFNNAGFALWPDNLMRYVGDPLINLVLSSLFIIGGIGFTVLVDVWRKRSFKKFSLHTKLMLVGTLVINVTAMFIIFVIEYSNPATLGDLSSGSKLLASYFQAVTPRTAGFNTLDMASLEDTTLFLMVILMFIGAGSASTGGGIKLTTAIIILLATITFLRGREEISIAKRSINTRYIVKALAITVASLLFVLVAVFILTLSENLTFMEILFEVVSAFGTVGLSMSVTPKLSDLGKEVIIFIMFLGKVGPLTLLFSIAKPQKQKIKYPNEDILTG